MISNHRVDGFRYAGSTGILWEKVSPNTTCKARNKVPVSSTTPFNVELLREFRHQLNSILLRRQICPQKTENQKKRVWQEDGERLGHREWLDHRRQTRSSLGSGSSAKRGSLKMNLKFQINEKDREKGELATSFHNGKSNFLFFFSFWIFVYIHDLNII